MAPTGEEGACGDHSDICRSQAARMLLGPYRPSLHTCQHGTEFTLDGLFPKEATDV